MSAGRLSAALLVAACLVGTARAQDDPTQSSSASVSTVLISLAINAAIAAAQFGAFLILRPRFRKIYQPKSFLGPKEERVDAQPAGLFGWVMPLIRTPMESILEKQGLDAYMFMEFLQMMVWILAPLFVLTWIVLLPTYAAGTTGQGAGFQRLVFGKIGSNKQETKRYAAPLIVHYIATFWILYQIRIRLTRFLKVRQQWLTSPQRAASAQARTLLVTGIPNDYMSVRKLESMYSVMPGGIERIWLHRELKDLPDLHDERLKLLGKLESAEAKIVNVALKKVKKGKVPEGGDNLDPEASSTDPASRYLLKKERPTFKVGAKLGCFGGEKHDAVTYLREEIARLNTEINERRSRLETDKENYPPVNSAFILFRTQIGCYTARNATAHHEPYRMADRFVDAHPNDVVWANLSMNPYEKRVRNFVGWAVTIALVIFWTVITGFIGIVSNVQSLCVNVPFLSWLCDLPGPVVGIIQGFLPTILLAVLMALLPIFLRLVGRLSGLPTRRAIELSLANRMFIFSIVQNYLLLTIVSGVAGGVQPFVMAFQGNIGTLPTLLSQSIPKANTFFLTFVTLQGLAGFAAGFLQIAPLAVYYIKKFILGSTPRAVWHIENNMGSVAWGTLWPSIMLITVISIGYMILAPIMNGFATVFFLLYIFLYKYLFVYVYDIKPETETGGLFFKKAVNQLLVGLLIEEIIVMVLFFTGQYINADGSTSQAAIPQGVLMAILLALTIGFWWILMDSVGDLDTALPLSLAAQNAQRVEFGSSPNADEKSAETKVVDGHAAAANGGSNDILKNGEQGGAHAEEESNEKTFMHPAARDEARTLWFPNDRLGLGDAAVASAKQHRLDVTNAETTYNDKNRLETTAEVPPGESLE